MGLVSFAAKFNRRRHFVPKGKLVETCSKFEKEVQNEIFPENWDSKAPSIGTLLACLETMA